MPVDLTIQYCPRQFSFDRGRLLHRTQSFLDRLGRSGSTVSILLVDDREMTRLNHQYRGKNKPTNVLSFSMLEGMDVDIPLPFDELGDIVISLDTALREAGEQRRSPWDHISWLIVHGLLHLLGFDHERSDQEAREMYDREMELLNRPENHRRPMMTRLAINVDHVATVRQSRGSTNPIRY